MRSGKNIRRSTRKLTAFGALFPVDERKSDNRSAKFHVPFCTVCSFAAPPPKLLNLSTRRPSITTASRAETSSLLISPANFAYSVPIVRSLPPRPITFLPLPIAPVPRILSRFRRNYQSSQSCRRGCVKAVVARHPTTPIRTFSLLSPPTITKSVIYLSLLHPHPLSGRLLAPRVKLSTTYPQRRTGHES